jgi:hypothetical protein
MTYLLTQDLVLPATSSAETSEQLYRIGQFLCVAVIANRSTKLQMTGIVSVPFTKESKSKQTFSGVYDVQRLLTVIPDTIRHPEYF